MERMDLVSKKNLINTLTFGVILVWLVLSIMTMYLTVYEIQDLGFVEANPISIFFYGILGYWGTLALFVGTTLLFVLGSYYLLKYLQFPYPKHFILMIVIILAVLKFNDFYGDLRLIL
jgi:hypothetical protein